MPWYLFDSPMLPYWSPSVFHLLQSTFTWERKKFSSRKIGDWRLKVHRLSTVQGLLRVIMQLKEEEKIMHSWADHFFKVPASQFKLWRHGSSSKTIYFESLHPLWITPFWYEKFKSKQIRAYFYFSGGIVV